MTQASALVAMYATALFGWVALRSLRPWHITGTVMVLMLLNVVLFGVTANASGPWAAGALLIQVVGTAIATVAIRREWLQWRTQVGYCEPFRTAAHK